MTLETQARALDVVAQWRRSADSDNPAGPLYAGGRYAEVEIIEACGPPTGQCGTACTYSATRYCC
jgi:hypothetical protein